MEDLIYLDNNATTCVDDEVVKAMVDCYEKTYGNSHSKHKLGTAAKQLIASAQGEVAQLLACSTDEVRFTSSGVEANAFVIFGLLDTLSPRRRRRKIVTTTVDHPSILKLLRTLNVDMALIPVDGDGVLDRDAIEREIDDTTLLVSVMLAQNETGVIHPVAEIAERAHSYGALVHVDAVQAAGKIAVDLRELKADFLSISGHKFHAPKGIGALAIAKNQKLEPLWYGGAGKPNTRPGTEPTPLIVGLGTGARIARERLSEQEGVRVLRDRLETELKQRAGGNVNGDTQPRLPNTTNISFEGVDTYELINALDEKDICVSGGAACEGIKTRSATMEAMGKPASVRISLSRYTTPAEIDATLIATLQAIDQLRRSA